MKYQSKTKKKKPKQNCFLKYFQSNKQNPKKEYRNQQPNITKIITSLNNITKKQAITEVHKPNCRHRHHYTIH